jgi:hypothetical protein
MWQGGHNLSWGRIFPAGENRTYPFFVLASQIPDWAIAILLFTTALILIKFFEGSIKIPRVNQYLIVDWYPAVLLLFIFGYLLTTKPFLYDDIRQIIFIWALIVVIILQLRFYLIARFNLKLKTVYLTVVSLLIVITQVNGLFLQQYAYTYKNLIARISHPNGFETDYWAISSKEASNLIINKFDASKQTIVLAQPPGSFSIYLRESVNLNTSEDPDLFVTISRPTGLPDNYQSCPVEELIEKRQLFSTSVVMAYIRKCPKA